MSQVGDAFGALEPYYEEGDDGDAIRLSLEAIAGLLGEVRGVEADDRLDGVLGQLGADPQLIEMVQKLYDAAEGGSYGEGLSAEQARIVNDYIQDVYDPLLELLDDDDDDDDDEDEDGA